LTSDESLIGLHFFWACLGNRYIMDFIVYAFVWWK